MRVIDYAARARNERMYMAENKRYAPKPKTKPQFTCGSCFRSYDSVEECMSHMATCETVKSRWDNSGIIDGMIEEKK